MRGRGGSIGASGPSGGGIGNLSMSRSAAGGSDYIDSRTGTASKVKRKGVKGSFFHDLETNDEFGRLDDPFGKHDADAIDAKYMQLYESQIDPFKIEEFDRQMILSRLNVFERCLAGVTKFFMQDQWARHALLVYLALVHIFAVGYVLQVLNPQLIGEIDARWNSLELNTADKDLGVVVN
jgi:hypothetical protein